MYELLTTEQMRRADAEAIAGGTPGIVLMQRAGEGVARAALEMFDAGRGPLLVACGPGNNGGDGFVAATVLRAKGIAVRVGLLGDRAALAGDAALAAAAYDGPVEPLTPSMLAGAGAVVDALFGSGLSRPLAGEAAEIVAAVNRAGLPVLAVDVPSGLDGDTGRPLGAVVEATRTVTFFRFKPGHFLYPGRVLCGDLRLVQIGVGDGWQTDRFGGLSVNRPALWQERFLMPARDGHKYRRGHAAVLAGDRWSGGAARLAARAALRIGAGLVSMVADHEAAPAHAARAGAVMLRVYDAADGPMSVLDDTRINAALIGPAAGVGAPTRATVEALLASPRRVVLDADALTSFEADREQLFAAIGSAAHTVVLTPHDGEYQRLFGNDSVSQDRLGRARFAARRSGAVVILKGPDTVIAAPDGRTAINDVGSCWLATAGSGDVLAGMVTGLRAQGMPAFEAAAAAVYLHGLAGRQIGAGLIAEDLPEQLPAVLRLLLADRLAADKGPDSVSFIG